MIHLYRVAKGVIPDIGYAFFPYRKDESHAKQDENEKQKKDSKNSCLLIVCGYSDDHRLFRQ